MAHQNRLTQPTLLDSLAEQKPEGGNDLRPGPLFLEAAVFTGVGVYLMLSWEVAQGGVFSIFLAAAALSGRFGRLMRENRDNIWTYGKGSLESNRRTAVNVLMLFMGVASAYCAAVVVVGEARASTSFGFALEVAGLGQDNLLSRRFGDPLFLVSHNGRVLFTVFLLAFIYRGYGALLVLAWNASIWGLVLTFLVSRGLAHTDGSPVFFVLVAALAVLPHLLLEASAYILAALAAVFLSKGVMKYQRRTSQFRDVVRAVAILLVWALGLLVVAALVEYTLAPWLIGMLRAG